MDQQPTTQDILEAINIFSTHIDQRFDGIDQRFDGLDQRVEGVDKRVEGVEARMGRLETRMDSLDTKTGKIEKRMDSLDTKVGKIEATMVTKDYLDDKLADLRGDLVVLLRKEDNKFGALIGELLKEEVISQEAAKRILQMEPFPHLAL